MNTHAQETKSTFIGAHVTPSEHIRLRERAALEDRSVSSLIRRAVSRELDREETKP